MHKVTLTLNFCDPLCYWIKIFLIGKYNSFMTNIISVILLILQVKASLFAAGCFCDLAADFASVALEILLNVVISPSTSMAIRIAGVRLFAKMGCSYSIATRAHKVLHLFLSHFTFQMKLHYQTWWSVNLNIDHASTRFGCGWTLLYMLPQSKFWTSSYISTTYQNSI